MIAEDAKAALLREEHHEYYLTGELKYNFFTIGKAFDGPFIEWYRNGQIASVIEYKMSKLHGSFKQWAESGKLVSYTKFNEDLEVKDYMYKEQKEVGYVG